MAGTAVSTPDDFATKYQSNIAGISKANNVDMSTAEGMLKSNLTQGSNYAGGGNVSGDAWNQMVNDAKAGTGTTGNTSSIASQMLDAAKSPSFSGQTTTFSSPSGQLKAPVYNGRSIASLTDVSNALNIPYTKDPNTGQIKVNGNVVTPVGYDKSGSPIIQVRQFLNANGVQDQDIHWDPKTGNVTYTQPPANPTQQVQVPNYMSGLPQMPGMPQLQPFQAPDLSMYYQNLMPMQQSFTPNWNQYYQQAQNQTNPLVQNQINTLVNKQGQDITKMDEGMNAKGIFNSGLAVPAENQIRANTNDQVAKVLMTQQANIAKAAQQLYQDAFDQYYKGNTMAIQNNQMWLNQAVNQEKQAFAQWAQTQNLTMDQYKYALDAWDKMATLSQNDAKMQMQAQQDNNTNAMNWFKFNNLSAYQNSDLQQRMAQAMLPYQFQTANHIADIKQKDFQFDNLSAQQKMQDTLDQSKLNETIRHNQAGEQNAADNLKLKMMDMMGYDQSGNPTLNRQKFDETTNYHQQLIQDAQANITNSENKTVIDALTRQLITVDDQMKGLLSAGGKVDDTQYKALAKQADGLAGQLATYSNKGFYGNFPGQ